MLGAAAITWGVLGLGALDGGYGRWVPALIVWAFGWPAARALMGVGLVADRGALRQRGLVFDRRWGWASLRRIEAEPDGLVVVDDAGGRQHIALAPLDAPGDLRHRLNDALEIAAHGAGPLRLLTDRLELREWAPGMFAARDAFHVERWATDTQCTPRRPRWLRRRLFARRVADASRPVRSVWALAVHRPGEPEPIGEVSLSRSHALGTARAQLGFALHPDARGQGLATEAAGALLEWAFSSAHLQIIDAAWLPQNAPSGAVLRRIGFVDASPPPGYGETVAGRAARWMTCRRPEQPSGGVE